MHFFQFIGAIAVAAAAVVNASPALTPVSGHVTIVSNFYQLLHVHNVPAGGMGVYESSTVIAPGQRVTFPYSPLNVGTSIKIAKQPDLSRGIFQFEYTNTDPGSVQYQGVEMYVNLSDVDGRSSGVAGSHFIDAYIKSYPVGPKDCNVELLECPAWKECEAAFRFPADNTKVKSCVTRPLRFVVEINNPQASLNGA
ncbi:hypothetical protein EG329_011539 [Mollisiaceae sp. DMI_Dod_QoI]|nr:hypothetical protein EG329_011539 [Helotiales sp. DMI_Dod_QoI]